MIYLGMTIFSLSIVYILYLRYIMVNGINNPGYFTTIAGITYWRNSLISIVVKVHWTDFEVKQRPKYIVQASNLKEPTHDKVVEQEKEKAINVIKINA